MHSANRIYVKSLIVVLLASASIKLVEVFRSAPYLQKGDWVFLYVLGSSAWSTGTVMLIGAVLELAVASILLVSADLVFNNTIAVMLSCGLVMYRVIHWSIGAPDTCPCLGRAGDWLKLSRNATQYISTSMLVYLLVGSTVFLISHLVRDQCKLKSS